MKMLRFPSPGGRTNLLLVSVFRWRAAVLAKTFGVALGVGGYFLLSTSVFPQGSLTPPGAPTPTMKTLDQIDTHIDVKGEKRIDLQNAPAASVTTTDPNYHFIITQPGSYYLSANLGVTKLNGIHVTVAAVTVDLNGFQISRSTGSGGDGITIDDAAHRCTIKNGSVSGFGDGIYSNLGRGGSVLQISVSGCTSAGIFVFGPGWEISGCKAHDNTGIGIRAGSGSALTNCTATFNQGLAGIYAGDGSSLNNCAAYSNTSTNGIFADTGSSLTNCTARANTSTDPSASAGIFTNDGCTLTHCSARSNTAPGNTSAGIMTAFGSTIIACTAEQNSNTNATPTGSTGAGIIAGGNSTVENCLASGNKGDGINASDASGIIANVCVTNGAGGNGAGVHVSGANNRIEGNNVTSNTRGIQASAAGNLIIKNSARSNPQSGTSANYVIAIGNSVGPIQLAGTNATAISGPASSTASTLGNTDPWANFSY